MHYTDIAMIQRINTNIDVYMDIMETARLKRNKEVRMEITAGTEVLVAAYKSKILSSLSASILHVYLFLSRVSFSWEKHVLDAGTAKCFSAIFAK